MSLFNNTVRPPAILSDEAVERYLAAVRAEIQVDPLFRRRLRGQVMNQYVAAREGGMAAPPRRRMGKLGRAVLYTSFALAATSTSVLAASQGAVPGDLLYPLKLQVEQLRADVLPEEFQDDLAAYELTQRIQELSVLAERGDVARLTALAALIQREYESLVVSSRGSAAMDDPQFAVITGLLASLPGPAQEAIDEARRYGPDWAPGLGAVPPGDNSGVGPPELGTNRGQDRGSDTDNDGADRDTDAAEPTPKPTRSPKPVPTLAPTPAPGTPLPDPTPAKNGGGNDRSGNNGSGNDGPDAQGQGD